MSELPPPRARGARRWLGRAVFGMSIGLILSTSGVLAIYVSRPESGPGHELLDAIESPIRQNEELQYNVHRALGRVFSLCPCTAGLSADQYRRASYHRPQDETQAR